MKTETNTPTYEFIRIQRRPGFWGQTELRRSIKVRAASIQEAEQKVEARKDAFTRLSNGDHQYWSYNTCGK